MNFHPLNPCVIIIQMRNRENQPPGAPLALLHPPPQTKSVKIQSNLNSFVVRLQDITATSARSVTPTKLRRSYRYCTTQQPRPQALTQRGWKHVRSRSV